MQKRLIFLHLWLQFYHTGYCVEPLCDHALFSAPFKINWTEIIKFTLSCKMQNFVKDVHPSEIPRYMWKSLLLKKHFYCENERVS